MRSQNTITLTGSTTGNTRAGDVTEAFSEKYEVNFSAEPLSPPAKTPVRGGGSYIGSPMAGLRRRPFERLMVPVMGQLSGSRAIH